MGTLLMILLVLFVALALVVKFTERFGTRLEPEQQAKLWRVLVVLIFASLIIQFVRYVVVN